MSNKPPLLHSSKRPSHWARASSQMNMTSMLVYKNGAIRTRPFVIAPASMHEMTMVTAFMKCTSIRSKAFGRCCALGSDRIGGYRRRTCPSISASLNSSTMQRSEGRLCLDLYWSCSSLNSLESILSQHQLQDAGYELTEISSITMPVYQKRSH